MSGLPEDQPRPPTIETVFRASEGILDRVLRCEGDLTGDGVPDQLVQAAFAFGGKSVSLRHWMSGTKDGGFLASSSLTLPDGIKVAWRATPDLATMLYVRLSPDGMFCASGEEDLRLCLR